MPEHDSLRRFIFEALPVQGRCVHLDATWRAVLERQKYPAPVRAVLGQAMTAAALLSATLKYEGSITLQIRGSGPLHLLVVQCTNQLQLRGLARWHGALPSDGGLSALAGDGKLALTIEPASRGERHQSIVPLEGATLGRSLEQYFARSEQLPTRLWLCAGDTSAAGFLLQVMPGREHQADAWQHTTLLADTVTDAELADLPPAKLLHRLFNEDDVRLFEPQAVSFRCQCSRERIEATLRSLGREEVEGVLREQGRVHVECEFCARQYDFDVVDVRALFESDPQPAASGLRH
ncbi:MAG TPA: Hsp33 family molecular chaperone HslO [Gammaproteobacteria bacterium]|nr:Hsp33 family molecular chaperone HslO [Gammaproteobacteria bacterium]